MTHKIIPAADDAPPATSATIRALIDRVYELEDSLAYSNSDQAAGAKGLDATTQALAGSVGELSARRIIGAEQAYDQTVPVGTSMPYTTPVLAAVTFTVDKPRLVRVDLNVYVAFTLQWSGSGSSAPQTGIQHHFNWNGVNVGTYSPFDAAQSVQNGVTSGFQGANRTSFFDLVILQPGTYTVGYCGVITSVNGTSGYTRIANPRVLVQMLEPVGGF